MANLQPALIVIARVFDVRVYADNSYLLGKKYINIIAIDTLTKMHLRSSSNHSKIS